MYEVIERLKMIVTQSNKNIGYHPNERFDGINDQMSHECISLGSNNNASHGELSQMIQNFDKMKTDEIIESLVTSNKQIIYKEILPGNDLSII